MPEQKNAGGNLSARGSQKPLRQLTQGEILEFELERAKLSPDEIRGRILRKNSAFVGRVGSSIISEAYQKKDRIDAIILSCSDARAVLGVYMDELQELSGNRFYSLRVAGNVASPSIINSIKSVLGRNPNAKVIVVGHTGNGDCKGCGAVAAKVQSEKEGIQHHGNIGDLLSLVETGGKTGSDADNRNLTAQRDRLELSLGIKVHALMLDLSNLELKEIGTGFNEPPLQILLNIISANERYRQRLNESGNLGAVLALQQKQYANITYLFDPAGIPFAPEVVTNSYRRRFNVGVSFEAGVDSAVAGSIEYAVEHVGTSYLAIISSDRRSLQGMVENLITSSGVVGGCFKEGKLTMDRYHFRRDGSLELVF